MNTTVWLITFTCSEGKPVQVVHTHNCIADYRQLDPNATAQAIDCAAVAELIDAAKGVESSCRFEGLDPCEVLVKVDQDALLRMCAALVLARVGGAS